MQGKLLSFRLDNLCLLPMAGQPRKPLLPTFPRYQSITSPFQSFMCHCLLQVPTARTTTATEACSAHCFNRKQQIGARGVSTFVDVVVKDKNQKVKRKGSARCSPHPKQIRLGQFEGSSKTLQFKSYEVDWDNLKCWGSVVSIFINYVMINLLWEHIF